MLDANDDCHFSYPVIPGDVSEANDNAEILSSLCKDNNLLIVNNLKTPQRHFVSDKTHK